MGANKTGLCILSLSLSLTIASPATLSAGQSSPSGGPAARGFLPATAKIHGYSLTELATAWLAWGFGTPEAVNPLVGLRCEPSPLDSRIWFLPASLGGEVTSTCYVPQGTFLVLLALAFECSEAEGNGSTLAELTACNDENFEPNTVEVALNGNATNTLTTTS